MTRLTIPALQPAFWIFALAAICQWQACPARAGLREPDVVLYGTIVLGSAPVTADNTDVVVEARRHSDRSVIGSYAMGSIPAASNYYTIRLVLENAAPLANPSASLTGDVLDLVVRDSTGDRDSQSYTVGARGSVVELDFGSLDSDGNGLPDAWERLYFGRIGVDPNSTPAGDGMTVLQKYQLGIDPTKANAPHPADISPFDYAITINEITAYGLAWKIGKPWSQAPTNIPVEYVTRAGALWKGGERYTLSLAAGTNAPAWWINVADGTTGQAGPGTPRPTAKLLDKPTQPGLVARTLPDGFQPGSAFTVQLEVTVASSVSAYAVEEQVLPGWTILGATEDGNYLAATEVIRWGPFFDGQPRTLAYSVTPPPGAISGLFIGAGSFDGTNISTAGDSDLTIAGVAMRLEENFDPQNGIRLSLTGHPGRRYAIDYSGDLQAWTELVQVNADAAGHLGVEDGASLSVGARFYRARLLAP